jgi:hypothetical protein
MKCQRAVKCFHCGNTIFKGDTFCHVCQIPYKKKQSKIYLSLLRELKSGGSCVYRGWGIHILSNTPGNDVELIADRLKSAFQYTVRHKYLSAAVLGMMVHIDYMAAQRWLDKKISRRQS